MPNSPQNKKNPLSGRRAIFLDFAMLKYQKVIQRLEAEGVRVEKMADPNSLFEKIKIEEFDLCVVNLMTGGLSPFEMIANIKANSLKKGIKIIAVSRQVQKSNIQNTISAGASDYVAEPFDIENLYFRLVYHLKPVTIIQPSGYAEKEMPDENDNTAINVLVESLELLSGTEQGHLHSTFFDILKKVAFLLQSNRTSLIVADEKNAIGIVLASSDDEKFFDFPISLSKYPEILHVMNTGSFVMVEDVSQSTLTSKITNEVKTIQIASLMVFPVSFQGVIIGAMTVRRPKTTKLPSLKDLRIYQAIVNAMSPHTNVRTLFKKLATEIPIKTA